MNLPREHRHAYRRIADAASRLTDQDSTPREVRAAQISLYRGMRSLALTTKDPDLLTAARFFHNFILNQLAKGGAREA